MGTKKFEYELKGRQFIIQTDHQALIRIRDKDIFNNERIRRFIEKIQQYDFKMVYVKGKDMGIADDLSREQALTNSKNVKLQKKIQKSKWNKHVKVIDGVEYWISDKGNVREISPISYGKI